jgi:hypothetical protein
MRDRFFRRFHQPLPLILVLCLGVVRAGDSFDWFAASDLVRIFEDGYHCPEPRNAVDTFGIRGETVSAQCVLAAHSALSDVTVEITRMQHESKAVSLPPDAVRWNFVGSVPVPQNTPGARQTHIIRAAPARFPEYLSEQRSPALSQGRYQSVWLTIRIPADAVPGLYKGTATVKTDHGTASLPLCLRVYPPQMPDQRHLMVTFWYETSKFAKLHDAGEPYSEGFYKVLAAYAENMAAHRQNVFRINLSTIRATVSASGNLSFDFSRFDRWAEIFWKTGRMDRLETGFVAHHGPRHWEDSAVQLNDWSAVKEGTNETVAIPGGDYLPQFLPAFEAHLRQMGWLEKTLFHIADEPAAWAVPQWRKASQMVRKYAPGLRRIDAIEATNFWGDLEVWVPKLPHIYSFFETYKKAQREGKELWYYMAMPYEAFPNRFIDFPLIETRILYWLNYRFGLTGFLHWGFNIWTDNPFETMNRVTVGAGDAWTVYPKKGGLLDSVRWEETRNGLQDYEYLWLLEDRIAKIKTRAGSSGWWIDPQQRSVELAKRVISDVNLFTNSPEVLYETKAQVLRELMDLDRSPRLLVQTNPPEGSTVISGPGLIEVYGLAEPGVEVRLNGKPVELDSSGHFEQAALLSPDQNVVVVAARNAKGERTVRRAFHVIH